MNPLISVCPVDHITTSTLSFVNPLNESIQVSLKLQDSKDFELILNRKTKFTVPPKETLEVGYTYSPTSMTSSKGKILVEASPELIWIYPLQVCLLVLVFVY